MTDEKHDTTELCRVLYAQFNNPASLPPLEHSTRIIAQRGWQVLVLGAGQQSADALRFPANPRVEVQMLPYCPPGWRQKLHFFKFSIWVLRTALKWKPDWIYASDMMVCPTALVLSFFGRWRLVYHEHDSPRAGEVLSSFMRLVLWTRIEVARRAAFCIVPNQGRLEAFKKSTETARHVYSIWNCPARAEATNGLAQKDEQTLVVFYHGSIVPARVPLTVLQAISSFPNVRLRMAGYPTIGHPDYVDKLRAEAERLDMSERFEYLGIQQRAELLAHCKQADVGLSLMPENSSDINEQTMAGASNKPFDYLACGLPLLVSDLPDWNRLFVESGYAIACKPSEPESIAKALRTLMDQPERRRDMGARGRERILREWNYETQFSPVIKKMHSLASTEQ